VTSIDRTAYPRFRRSVPIKELQESFTPSGPEIEWARERTRTPEHLLALLLLLKAFQRLGCFPDLFEVPLPVVDHIRGVLGLASSVVGEHASSRTGERQRGWVRERLRVVFDPPAAEQLARQVISEAALSKDNPADLINVALEQLVAHRFELPGYTTLDELATAVRREVNDGIYATVYARISEQDRVVLTGLLRVDPVTRRSLFDELKRTAAAATVSRFREHVAHLTWLDGLGTTARWMAEVPPAKVSHFAAVARVSNAGDLREMAAVKQIVLIASLLHIARIRGRDDLATMYCKRMASIHKQARDRFERLRESARAETEHLVDVFGDVLAAVRESMSPSGGELDTGQVDPVEQVWQRTGQAVLSTLIAGGGVQALSTSHEQVSAFHGDNYLPFLEQHYRTSRATLFDMLDVLDLVPTTADRKVLDAVAFLQAGRRRSGELIPDHRDGQSVDLSFVSDAWRKILRPRRQPTKLVRRHFEVCVFSYLAAELRVGDIAVTGSESYANLQDQLLSWEECQPLIAGYCAEIGLPAEASAFRKRMEEQLTTAAQAVDVGYPDNADLVIDDAGQPILKRRRGNARRPSALALEQTVLARLPERSLLDVVARVAHWTGWPRHFGPVSGADPKIRDAFGRYVLLTFAYGANLGPYQMSRHMGGLVSPHQLGTALKHAGPVRIDAARTDVVNAYAQLDLPRLWGDGSHAAADGSQIDTWADNLLAETHIRYGGVGGLAYRHIADNYIALFTHFIPCGVWEAIYIIEGLLRNQSDLQPTSIHADTQGPVAAGLRAGAAPGIRAAAADTELERPDPLPAEQGGELPAHRCAVRPGQVDQLVADRNALARPAAGRAVHPSREDLLGGVAPPARPRLTKEQALPGISRTRPGDPHHCAAALPVRPGIAGFDRHHHQPYGVLQRVLPMAVLRQRRSGRQRPRAPGEAGQVQRAPGQQPDLQHHPGHHRGGQHPGRRGRSRPPGRPGHHLSVHHVQDQTLRRLGVGPHPAAGAAGQPRPVRGARTGRGHTPADRSQLRIRNFW